MGLTQKHYSDDGDADDVDELEDDKQTTFG